MSDADSFYGSPATGQGGGRRATAVIAALLVGLVGLAIVKPWGRAALAPSGPPIASSGWTASPAAASPVGEVAPEPAPGALPITFTAPLTKASTEWTGLRWRRLAPGDPLALVTSVTPWKRGFVAVGLIARTPSTPVWSSTDGTRWDALPFATGSSFWPGMGILGIASLPTGVVALGETVQYCGRPCPLAYELPVVAWTSSDGRRWLPHVLPPEWLASPSGRAPLFAEGPSGLLVATTGPGAHLAISTDGSRWRLTPDGTFPPAFGLTDLVGLSGGYVAVGSWKTRDARPEPATLWSGDGQTWPAAPTLLPPPARMGSGIEAAVDSLVATRDGVIAIGREAATPGGSVWWRSRDGRHWTGIPDFAPLGRTPCPNRACGPEPNGILAGDGTRFVALRSGTDAGAWVSTDGVRWQALAVTGDPTNAEASRASVVPGGVLLSDGTTTWFGQALGP